MYPVFISISNYIYLHYIYVIRVECFYCIYCIFVMLLTHQNSAVARATFSKFGMQVLYTIFSFILFEK